MPNTAFTQTSGTALAAPIGVGRNVVHPDFWQRANAPNKPSLQSTGLSSGALMPSDDLTDAKIARAQAETETKMARMEGAINTTLATIVGKIDALSGQVADQRRDRNLIIGTIVLAALALGGLFWGAITYGDAIFGRGMSVRDVVETVIREQQQHPIPSPPPKQP